MENTDWLLLIYATLQFIATAGLWGMVLYQWRKHDDLKRAIQKRSTEEEQALTASLATLKESIDRLASQIPAAGAVAPQRLLPHGPRIDLGISAVEYSHPLDEVLGVGTQADRICRSFAQVLDVEPSEVCVGPVLELLNEARWQPHAISGIGEKSVAFLRQKFQEVGYPAS